MKSQPQEVPLSQQEKMVLAQQEVERYQGLAANPNLSPRAAAWALDMARSAQASVRLRQKAIAWEAEQANPVEQGNDAALAVILGLQPSNSPPDQPTPSSPQNPST